MEHEMALGFLAAGIILLVLEMASVTFYLAALAFASLLTALIIWLYPMNGWQGALVFTLGSAVALPLAHLLRRRLHGDKTDPLEDMDKGNLVTVAQADGHDIKVKYRDSLWEAAWEGSDHPSVGQRAKVVARDGSRLRVKPVH